MIPLLLNKHRLSLPTVLSSDHLLLAVNKPPGWTSIPNADRTQDVDRSNSATPAKCLLTHLKDTRQGGGSKQDFLAPLHRIDQPCSGVLLFGKNSKAASRIQSNWNQIQKTYIVVLHSQSPLPAGEAIPSLLDRLASASQPLEANGRGEKGENAWMELKGLLERRRFPQGPPSLSAQHHPSSSSGWSVKMLPYYSKTGQTVHSEQRYRLCDIRWRSIDCLGHAGHAPPTAVVLEIQTNQGARHMIRALLAAHGLPLAGDLRYGASAALPDGSVALHARSLQIPDSVQLRIQQRFFQAPLPTTWSTYFGLGEHGLLDWEGSR